MAKPAINADMAVVAGSAAGVDREAAYVDWPAILGGAVLAGAIAAVFSAFGTGLGLTMTGSPWEEGLSAGWFMAAAALWFIWVQVSALMAGGYLAGRMRRRLGDATEHEVEVRDGAHGLLVWAVATLVGVVIAFSAASGAIGTAASLSGAATKGIASVAAGAAGNGEIESVLDRLYRPAADSPSGAAPSGAAPSGASPADAAGNTEAGDTETGNMGNGDVDMSESRDEVRRIIASSAMRGEISTEDKTYISRLIAANSGLSTAEAQARVDGYLSTALTEMRQAAEAARKAGIVVTFLTAATLLVSAIAGWWAAGMGGRHRDENVDLGRWFRIR